MPLILSALLSVALAADGSLVRVGVDADPSLRPELRDVPLAEAFPVPGRVDPGPAIERLRAELDAVRPLADEFDGELAIMSRLQAVIADVGALRDDADRELLHQALLFQGFAVQRYFQDGLADDPAAAPYRTEIAGQVAVSAWVDAAALDPDRAPAPADIPGDDELVAFDEVRALVRLAPKASVEVVGMPEGAVLLVDGRAADGDRAYMPPGAHRVRVMLGDQVVVWKQARVEPGGVLIVEPPPMADALLAVQPKLATGAPAVALPDDVIEALGALTQPVLLAAPGERGVLLYEVRGASAILVEAPPELEPRSSDGLSLGASVGAGWLYDGNFYSAQWDVAPHDTATVNAAAPVIGAKVSWRRGLFVAGAGVDMLIPVGELHSLPSGEGEVRLRAHPYVAAGLPWAQLSAGWLFPWHPAGGLRLALPLPKGLEVGGALLAGPGRELDRGEGQAPFAAAPSYGAWLSVGANFGAGR